MDDVRAWGIEALERAADGLECKTAVHICYGYGIKANIDWKKTLGTVAAVRADLPAARAIRHRPGLARVHNSRVPLELPRPAERQGRHGRRDRRRDHARGKARRRRPHDPRALTFVPPHKLYPCTNCGMVPLPRAVALGEARSARGRRGDRARRACEKQTLTLVSSDEKKKPPRRGSMHTATVSALAATLALLLGAAAHAQQPAAGGRRRSRCSRRGRRA